MSRKQGNLHIVDELVENYIPNYGGGGSSGSGFVGDGTWVGDDTDYTIVISNTKSSQPSGFMFKFVFHKTSTGDEIFGQSEAWVDNNGEMSGGVKFAYEGQKLRVTIPEGMWATSDYDKDGYSGFNGLYTKQN